MAKLVDVIEHNIFENMIVSLFSSTKNDKIRILNNIRFLYKILRLITIAIMMTYFMGCFWYLFCDKMSKYFSENDFITVYKLESLSEIERLIVSSYFILTTLTTVGYGDYVATNNAERFVVIFIMLLGVGMFSYVMGNLNELISSYEKNTGVKDKTPDLHNWISLLQKFTKKKFNSNLIKKIDKHFLYYWENDRNSSISKDDPYLISLPKSMKIKVMEFLWGDVFNRFSNFFVYYPGNKTKYFKFYYDISFLFQPRFFNYNEGIYKANEECEEMYLIMEGYVELGYLNSFDPRVKYFKDIKSFDFIGDFYCLFNIKSRYFYRASSDMKAYAINKFDFLKALERYEDLYNKLRVRSYRRYNDFIKIPMEKFKEEETKIAMNQAVSQINLSACSAKGSLESFPSHNSSSKKLNSLFINKLRRHKGSIKSTAIEIEKKFVKLDDDFMNIAKKFHDVSNHFEKEMIKLNTELEEIQFKIDKNQISDIII